MSNQTVEAFPNAPENDDYTQIEADLAVAGLSAQIDRYNNGTQPFGIDQLEPVDTTKLTDKLPTAKWCTKRMDDGTWDLVIDGTD